MPNVVCSQRCTGAVVVSNCTLGDSSAPATQQTCTISFGKSSAAISICINQQGSFSCSGMPTGQAICSGCVDSSAVRPTALPVPPTTASAPGTGPANITSPVTTATVTPGAASAPAVPIPIQNFTNGTVGASSPPPSAGVVTIYAPAPESTQAPSVSRNSGQSTKSSSSVPAASSGNNTDPVDSTSTSIAALMYSTKTSVQIITTIGLAAVGVLVL